MKINHNQFWYPWTTFSAYANIHTLNRVFPAIFIIIFSYSSATLELFNEQCCVVYSLINLFYVHASIDKKKQRWFKEGFLSTAPIYFFTWKTLANWAKRRVFSYRKQPKTKSLAKDFPYTADGKCTISMIRPSSRH